MPVPSKLTKWQAAINIRDHRIARGMTQAELAALLGLSTGTIANYENGTTMPRASQIWSLARHLGINDELAEYMEMTALDGGSQNLEVHPRLNALSLARAEMHYNSIWKWEPVVMPGILQTRAYQYTILRSTEDLTDHQAQFGWDFKQRRQEDISRRRSGYRISFVVGDTALYHLRMMTPDDRREQIEYLRECNTRRGWEIRVMADAHDLGGPFEVYVPAESKTAGPPFVYTQIHDLSWCIEELERVKLYHDRVKKNWPRAIPLEEFLDAERDRLA